MTLLAFDTFSACFYNCAKFVGSDPPEARMDSLMNQLAREMTDAIASVVASDPKVEACREKARAAGLDMRVSLETVIGFAEKPEPAGRPKPRPAPPKATFEMSANDRRFLKSLRISADETTEKEVE
jgi:hypothetical protein